MPKLNCSFPLILVGLIVTTTIVHAQSGSFWQDGNLVATHQPTENGTHRFIVNDGFLTEPNRSMIFCSALAEKSTFNTCLGRRDARVKLYSETLWALAVQPAFESVPATDSAILTGWISGKFADVAMALDAFKMNYWDKTESGAELHNTIAKTLRRINPRTWNKALMETTNLKSLGRMLDKLSIGMTVSAAALGALIQSAFYSDLALGRLSILDEVFRAHPDPAIMAGIRQVREELTMGETQWEAFLVEMTKQKDVFIKLGMEEGLKLVFKALKIKGSLGVILVLETIMSDWEQHSEAQGAVLAATIEDALSAAAAKDAGSPRQCELKRMAENARYIYFDGMVKVTSVWQGQVVDLLRKGTPYADARAYFNAHREARIEIIKGQRQNACWIPEDSGLSVDKGEAVIVIDSSGSMADNDPQRLRIQASQLLAGRLISDRPVSIVKFDERANLLVAHETSQPILNAAISGIGSNGRTCIPSGLEVAASALNDGGGDGMVVLFSDGQNTACQGDAPSWFSENGVPIFVVGLSDAVNETYLQRMAFATRGEYMKASRASDLAGIFDWIGTMAGMEDLIDEFSGKISQGEVNEFPFFMDSMAERLTCRIWYPGSHMVLDLITPDSTVLAKKAQAVRNLVGKTYELLEVNSPKAGIWKVRLTALETDPGGEPFNIRVGMKSKSPVTVKTVEPGDADGLYQFDIQYDPGAISVKGFDGRVVYPNGTSDSLPPDSPGHWEVPKPAFGGVYQFLFYLEGVDKQGFQLKRIAQKSVFIDGPQMPNNPVIIRIEGAIGVVNMGQNVGLRPGMRVEFRSGGNLVGYGFILSVFYEFSQVEFTEPRGRTWRIGDEAIPFKNPER
jgi:Mg-chelatase subunit ChlD